MVIVTRNLSVTWGEHYFSVHAYLRAVPDTKNKAAMAGAKASLGMELPELFSSARGEVTVKCEMCSQERSVLAY